MFAVSLTEGTTQMSRTNPQKPSLLKFAGGALLLSSLTACMTLPEPQSRGPAYPTQQYTSLTGCYKVNDGSGNRNYIEQINSNSISAVRAGTPATATSIYRRVGPDTYQNSKGAFYIFQGNDALWKGGVKQVSLTYTGRSC